jgi:hypothetical protein
MQAENNILATPTDGITVTSHTGIKTSVSSHLITNYFRFHSTIFSIQIHGSLKAVI